MDGRSEEIVTYTGGVEKSGEGKWRAVKVFTEELIRLSEKIRN